MKFVVALLMTTTVAAFSRNAVKLGLVSEEFPIEFWDVLATMEEDDLSPWFRRVVLYADKTRAGNEHWCCNHGKDQRVKDPVYNDRGEVVAWNFRPCPNLGCCEGYLEVANHCLDEDGQDHVVTAVELAAKHLNDRDKNQLIALIKAGGSIGK